MTRYVIAASRPWYGKLADKLRARTGSEFLLISRPEEFTAERMQSLSPAKIFVPHWSERIPEQIFGRFEVIVFHMTDLPYGRGGSPLQNLIVRGHDSTKISAIRCEAGLDTGPVYLKKELSLAGSAREIFERAVGVIEEMIVELVEHEIKPVPQSGDPVVFPRRKPAESDISTLTDLRGVYDHIRMLDAEGYPHAFAEIGRLRFEFTDAEARDGAVTARVRIKLKPDE